MNNVEIDKSPERLKKILDRINNMSPEQRKTMVNSINSLPPDQNKQMKDLLNAAHEYENKMKNEGVIHKSLSSIGQGLTGGVEELANLGGRIVGKNKPIFKNTSSQNAPYPLLSSIAKTIPTAAGIGAAATFLPESIPEIAKGMIAQSIATGSLSDMASEASKNKNLTKGALPMSALEGGTLGLLTGGLVKGAGKVLNKGYGFGVKKLQDLKDAITKKTLDPMMKNLSDIMTKRLSSFSSDDLLNKYNSVKQKAKTFGDISNLAKKLDKKMGFESSYDNPNKRFDKLTNISKKLDSVLNTQEEVKKPSTLDLLSGKTNNIKEVNDSLPNSFSKFLSGLSKTKTFPKDEVSKMSDFLKFKTSGLEDIINSKIKNLKLPEKSIETIRNSISDFEKTLSAEKPTDFPLKRYLGKSSRILKESSKLESALPALGGFTGTLKNLIRRKPTSLSDAVLHKQAINQLPKSYNEPINSTKDALAARYSHELGKVLDSDVLDNVLESNDSDVKDFVDSWKGKRKDWGKYKEFFKNPSASNKRANYDRNFHDQLNKGDVGKYIRNFIPKVGEDANKRIEHLSKLLGNEKLAKNLVQKASLEDKGVISTNRFGKLQMDMDKFSKYMRDKNISPHLKNIFTDEEKKLLGNIDFVKDIFSQVDDEVKGRTSKILKHTMFPLLGGIIGNKFSHPLEGIALGAGFGSVGTSKIHDVFEKFLDSKAEQYLKSGEISKLKKLSDDLGLDTHRAYRQHLSELRKPLDFSKIKRYGKYPMLELISGLSHNDNDQ